jgi:predicted dehydrogenase
VTYNVGVIGLGVGSKHLDAYVNNPLCRVKLICDFDEQKINEHKESFPNIKSTVSAQHILNDPDIQIVSIASYDQHHASQIIEAFKNRKHVFIEKPLCTTRKEFEEIKKAHQRNPDLVVSTNFILRREPRFAQLKNRIDNGLLGKIFFAEGTYDYGRLPKLTNGWRGKDQNYSVMHGGGIHIIDILTWLVGSRFKPSITLGNKFNSIQSEFKNYDLVFTAGTFENGAIGKIAANYGSATSHFHQLKLYGTKGTFIHDCGSAKYFFGREPNVEIKLDQTPFPASNKGDMIPEFIDFIAKKRDSLSVDFQRVCEIMETSIEIEEKN